MESDCLSWGGLAEVMEEAGSDQGIFLFIFTPSYSIRSALSVRVEIFSVDIIKIKIREASTALLPTLVKPLFTKALLSSPPNILPPSTSLTFMLTLFKEQR